MVNFVYEGKKLGHYQVGQIISHGYQGQVYEVVDTTVRTSNRLVIKISEDSEELEAEVKALQEINSSKKIQQDKYGVPPIVKQGTQGNFAYYITQRYEQTLQEFLDQFSRPNNYTIFEILIQLVKIIEDVHNARYTYNDIKPDNIMLSTSEEGEIRISLIDFGFAKKYKEDGLHVSKNQKRDVFQGNLLFASPNHLNFNETSRKDDLYALMYLMFFMFNDGLLPDFQHFGQEVMEQLQGYKMMSKYKEMYTLTKMIELIDLDPIIKNKLYDVVSYVEKLKFSSRPAYS